LVNNQPILVLAMYGLHRLDRGPQVRIYNLTRALADLAPIELIAAERPERPAKIRAFLRDKGLSHITGLHVEANTSWANLSDLRLMAACKRRSIPIITFIPDAHPLFPDVLNFPRWKKITTHLLWWASLQAYYRLSDAIAFQSQSFANLFHLPSNVRQMILPPGANQVTVSPLTSETTALLYAGNGRAARYGLDILLNGADLARRDVPNLHITLICPPEDAPPPSLLYSRSWVTLKHLQTNEIINEMPNTRAVIIPFQTIAYHHLLLPTKLMDYMSYGRPMLVTRCREIAHFVEENRVGLVIDDTPESMAEGIRRLFTANLDELNQMGQNALRAVREKHSWQHRAQQLLDTFEQVRQSRFVRA
jgi:glycosyltransferase involved in cell wall biosynthesis